MIFCEYDWFCPVYHILIQFSFYFKLQAVEGLLDHYAAATVSSDQQELSLRFRECHLMVLKGLADARALGPGWAQKEVTRSVFSQKY